MGVDLLVFGYIQEIWLPGLVGGSEQESKHRRDMCTEIGAHDDEVLGALPEEDDNDPPLCRPMFGWPVFGPSQITYCQRLVHFGASFKNADYLLRDWIDKFEALLRKLYWEEAYVRVERGYVGTHEFRWKVKEVWRAALYAGELIPIAEWDFTTTLNYLDSLRHKNESD